MRGSGRITPAQNLAEAPGQCDAKPERPLPGLWLVQPDPGNRIDIADSRLAVILIADAVDYSRRMAADEAGTYARISSIFRTVVEPGIARHSARIVKNTGDGFLALFWSATSAVWFAVEFQNSVRAWNIRRSLDRRLDVRVGINLGDVIVAQHDVYGHNVNIAARLEAHAEPGGVLVSHAVFSSVRDPRLCFEDAGDLSLRNLNETVRSFRVRSGPPRRSFRPQQKE